MKKTVLYSLLLFMGAWTPLMASEKPPSLIEQKEEIASFLTANEYCSFLNSVAATDRENLYEEKQETDNIAGTILRSGVPGSYSYSVLEGREENHVAYLSQKNKEGYTAWSKKEIFFEASFCDEELRSNLIEATLIDSKVLKNLEKKSRSSSKSFSWENLAEGIALVAILTQGEEALSRGREHEDSSITPLSEGTDIETHSTTSGGILTERRGLSSVQSLHNFAEESTIISLEIKEKELSLEHTKIEKDQAIEKEKELRKSYKKLLEETESSSFDQEIAALALFQQQAHITYLLSVNQYKKYLLKDKEAEEAIITEKRILAEIAQLKKGSTEYCNTQNAITASLDAKEKLEIDLELLKEEMMAREEWYEVLKIAVEVSMATVAMRKKHHEKITLFQSDHIISDADFFQEHNSVHTAWDQLEELTEKEEKRTPADFKKSWNKDYAEVKNQHVLWTMRACFLSGIKGEKSSLVSDLKQHTLSAESWKVALQKTGLQYNSCSDFLDYFKTYKEGILPQFQNWWNFDLKMILAEKKFWWEMSSLCAIQIEESSHREKAIADAYNLGYEYAKNNQKRESFYAIKAAHSWEMGGSALLEVNKILEKIRLHKTASPKMITSTWEEAAAMKQLSSHILTSAAEEYFYNNNLLKGDCQKKLGEAYYFLADKLIKLATAQEKENSQKACLWNEVYEVQGKAIPYFRKRVEENLSQENQEWTMIQAFLYYNAGEKLAKAIRLEEEGNRKKAFLLRGQAHQQIIEAQEKETIKQRS